MKQMRYLKGVKSRIYFTDPMKRMCKNISLKCKTDLFNINKKLPEKLISGSCFL